MGRSRDSKRRGAAVPRYLPGAWQDLLAKRRADVDAVDARLTNDFAAHGSAVELAQLDRRRRERAAALVASMEAGERQSVAAWTVSNRRGAERVTYLTDRSDHGAAMVWVYPDDRVELHQTRGQKLEQARIVAKVSPVIRIADDGTPVPRGYNAETKQWEDIGPGDVVETQGEIRDGRWVDGPDTGYRPDTL